MEKMNDAKAGHGGPEFRIIGGFHEISDFIIVMGLAISGSIIDTQLMFLNALVTSLEVQK